MEVFSAARSITLLDWYYKAPERVRKRQCNARLNFTV